MEDKILQIGKILSLSSTNTRSNTVSSLVASILYAYKEELSINEILDFIHDTFKIKPFINEIEEAIQESIVAEEITSKNSRYLLTQEKFNEIRKKDLRRKSVEEERYKRFETLLNSIEETNNTKIKILWSVFTDYLYECFYQYGENAVTHFNTDDDENYKLLVDSNPFKNAIEKLTTEYLKDIFKRIIILFLKNLSNDDVEYLESLSKKTIAFYSLGLPKELHDEFIDLEIIDWTVYVDTNFLFSILNLHIHSENKACEDLLKLCQRQKLNIKFRYTPFTMAELKQKRADFETSIPKSSLKKSHISALLKSGNLDSYSQAYYERLQENSESTLHPVDIIDLSDTTLQSVKKIGFYNSKFQNITDEHINEKIIEYNRYIQLYNDARLEKGMSQQYKSQKQLYHDVFLREVIEYQQHLQSSDSPVTMAEVKFLGVTLDKLLIKYDKYALSKESARKRIPNFYLPSFLLSKLYRLVPIDTTDYKKAFISSIASFSFSESGDYSLPVQKFVNYFRDQGLEDEKLLLSLITDKFFINKFFEDETNQPEFLESEVNRKITAVHNKFEEATEKLNVITNAHIASEVEKKEQKLRIDGQQSIISQLADNEKVLKSIVKKLRRTEKPVIDPSQLNILDVIEEKANNRQNEALKIENEQLKINENSRRKKESDKYIRNHLRMWKLRSWLPLLTSLLIFSCGFVYVYYLCNWEIRDTTNFILNVVKENVLISIIIFLLSSFINGYLVKLIYDRYEVHSNIKAYTEKIEIPEDMKPLKI